MSVINYTVIGEQPTIKKETVRCFLNGKGKLYNVSSMCIGVDEVELICLNYKGEGEDLMFGYNKAEGRNRGTLYVGKWNR